MLKKYYVTPDTQERLEYLPKTYKGVSPLTESNCTRFGWQVIEETVPDPVVDTTVEDTVSNVAQDVVEMVVNLASNYDAVNMLSHASEISMSGLYTLLKSRGMSEEVWNEFMNGVNMKRLEIEEVQDPLWQNIKGNFATLVDNVVNNQLNPQEPQDDGESERQEIDNPTENEEDTPETPKQTAYRVTYEGDTGIFTEEPKMYEDKPIYRGMLGSVDYYIYWNGKSWCLDTAMRSDGGSVNHSEGADIAGHWVNDNGDKPAYVEAINQ